MKPEHIDSPLRRSTLDSLVDAASQVQESQRNIKPATAGMITSLVAVLAFGLVVWGAIMGIQTQLVIGIALVFVGVTIGWTQMSFVMDNRLHPDVHTSRLTVMAVIGSVFITICGVLMMFTLFSSVGVLLLGALAGIVMLVAVGLIIAPWWISLVSDLGMQRARTAREELRADIAARLHDSVLQTLALIQLQSHDAQKVASLARAQERELREWLYGDPEAVAHPQASAIPSAGEQAFYAAAGEGNATANPMPQTTTTGGEPSAMPSATLNPTSAEPFSRVLKRVAAHVEDTREQPIEVIIVGECRYSPALAPLLDAAAEAMNNAAKHGAPPIAVYMEAGANRVQVFVRDHGDGFNPESLPVGHLGVKESIIGRMRRSGGTAQIVSRAGWGTEVRLTQPL